MEMSWSHTPSSVWWALDASSSATSLEGDQNSPPGGDPLGSISMRARSPTLRPLPHMPGKEVTNFYDYAGEGEEGEEDMEKWILQQPNRGAIRVYQPGSSYSETVCCTTDTTADTIIARCLAKELVVHYGSGHHQSVRFDEKPLEIQNRFLQSLGYTDPQRVQLEGLSQDLGPLFRFATGYEQGKRPEERVQLACALRVKEMTGLSVWNKRFCVLCGARLFIFSGPRPKGKPSLVLDLAGGKMLEHKSKKSYYCVRVSASRRDVLLSFDSRLEQSRWLERAAKVVSKHPLEANLSGNSLERLPKFFFLNYYLVALNLSRNIMKENYSRTMSSRLGSKVRVIGWINDLAHFHHLVSLSLSDNHLDQFPVSLCAVHTLQELDISRNRIKVLPQEIQRLTNLTTLLLHSNHLTSLPRGLVDLKRLSTLVLAFNRFIELPPLLKEVPSLSILIISGNNISAIPEGIALIENLRHLDCRLNRLKSPLPASTQHLPHLSRVNLRGTAIRELDTKILPFVEDLNCSDNKLRSLTIYESPLRSVTASNNSISQFSVAATCSQLTSINLSRNQLRSLPEPLTGVLSLEKLDVSHNRLTRLPPGIFAMPELKEFLASDNRLTSLPSTVGEGCGLLVIDLHENQLTSLPQQLIMRAAQLETLNVSSNQLSVLPLVSANGPGPALSSLLAADNRLSDGVLARISCCRNLKVLHLAYNKLENILPGAFVQLKQLEYLNLSGNHALSSLPSLSHCLHLHTLCLHSTLISTLPERKLVTLDLARNKISQLPTMGQFGRLKYLDLSENEDLKIKESDASQIRSLKRCVLEGGLGIHSDARAMSQVECGVAPPHNLWSFGSAQSPGVAGGADCTVQVKSPCLSGGRDALFAILNGGRSTAAPAIIQPKLAEVLMKEFSDQWVEPGGKGTPPESLRYLTHTFLKAHQMLGEVGCSYGCSMTLCHIHMLRSKKLVLNVASAGLGEAILCHRGHTVPLARAHSPATNKEERERVKDAGGFISQDCRVNGVCGTTRLIGCYHLGPEVISAPSTTSLTLSPGDNHVIIGTDSLWKFVSRERAVGIISDHQSPGPAARKLRDLAIACGSRNDVSVIVVRMSVPDLGAGLEESMFHSKESVSSEPDPEEEVEFTNIDDLLSDTEDSVEQGLDSTWNGVRLRKKGAGPLPLVGSADIDQMILNAVSSPPTSPFTPEMKSTNIDDILSPLQPLPTEQTNRTGAGGERKRSSHAPPTGHAYPAQTIPRDAAGSRSKGGDSFPPLPPSQAIDYEQFKDSFEVTQSAPIIPADQQPPETTPTVGVAGGQGNGVIGRQRIVDEAGFGGSLQRETDERRGRKRDIHERGLRGDLARREIEGGVAGGNMEGYLAQLNQALTNLDSDPALQNGTEPQARNGGMIQRRLSYVEHSYQQLTNNVYSEGANVGQGQDNDLHHW